MSPSSASPSSRSGSDSESGSAEKRSASTTLSSGRSDLDGQLGERGGGRASSSKRPGLLQADQRVAGVDGQADRPTRVGDAAGDGLADPPRGVGRELEALAPVELLDGVHEAEVPLLDEVEEREPGGLVLLGDRHDQAQVRLDEGRSASSPWRVAAAARRRATGSERPSLSKLVRASTPASMACASRTSSSLVSSGCWPMSVRYSRTRSRHLGRTVPLPPHLSVTYCVPGGPAPGRSPPAWRDPGGAPDAYDQGQRQPALTRVRLDGAGWFRTRSS